MKNERRFIFSSVRKGKNRIKSRVIDLQTTSFWFLTKKYNGEKRIQRVNIFSLFIVIYMKLIEKKRTQLLNTSIFILHVKISRQELLMDLQTHSIVDTADIFWYNRTRIGLILMRGKISLQEFPKQAHVILMVFFIAASEHTCTKDEQYSPGMRIRP